MIVANPQVVEVLGVKSECFSLHESEMPLSLLFFFFKDFLLFSDLNFFKFDVTVISTFQPSCVNSRL